MTEIVILKYCPKCKEQSTFTCSGSMNKGSCDKCGLDIKRAKLYEAMLLK